MSGECAPWAHVHTAGTHQRGRQKLEKIVYTCVRANLEFQNARETTGLTPCVEPSRRHKAKATVEQDRGAQQRGGGLRELGVSEDTGRLRRTKGATSE